MNELLSASDVARTLNFSRGYIDILRLKGLLKPVPTIHPKYYFRKDEVLQLKESIESKKQKV